MIAAMSLLLQALKQHTKVLSRISWKGCIPSGCLVLGAHGWVQWQQGMVLVRSWDTRLLFLAVA